MDENHISDIPGVRFYPSDEELITFYLQRKVKCLPLPAHVINDIELYSYDPSDLPRKALFGDHEWYFFTPRDRKYPNGRRPNRMAASGYWKATGTDKPIFNSSRSDQIGVKKALVFYQGKPPSGLKTDWIMTEYRLPDSLRPSRSRGSMRLDDWVICRIRKKGNMSKNEPRQDKHQNSSQLLESLPNIEDLSPLITTEEESNKDIHSHHLLSTEYPRIAPLPIEEGKMYIQTPPAVSSFQNISDHTAPGQANTTANEQRNLATQLGTNYSYWQSVLEFGSVFMNPGYATNACSSMFELDMPALLTESILQ